MENKFDFRAVIFDMDGTLLDTLEDIADSMNAVLKEMGFPVHNIEAYKAFTGDGIVPLVERAFPPEFRDKETVQAGVEKMQKEYALHWSSKTRPYDGIPELLDELVQRKIQMTILSNKLDRFTKLAARKFLSAWSFVQVKGITPSIPKKPAPDGALLIARALGSSPEEFVYIGDTDVDMKTANAAGMFPVGALWGFRSREELIENGAKVVVETPLEVLRLFDNGKIIS